MINHRHRLRAAIVTLLLGACSGGTEPVEPAVVLRVVDGEDQSGLSLDTLPDTLVVRAARVTEIGEEPVAGLEVAWTAVDAELGALTPAVSVTDERGYARARWTLGVGSGTQRAAVQVLNGTGQVTFEATAVPGLEASTLMQHNFATHSCAADAEGSTWCWGENRLGQLGNGQVTGSVEPILVPQRVVGSQKFVELDGMESLSCGLTDTGELWCWGATKDGWPVGDYDLGAPRRAAPDHAFKSVSMSDNLVCGVDLEALGYCWGRGVLGDGVADRRNIALDPVHIGAPLLWNEIVVASHEDTFGATAGLDIYGWGFDFTQRGIASNLLHYGVEHEGYLAVPTLIPLVAGLSNLAATYYGRCGLRDGSAVCWGDSVQVAGAPPGPFTVSAPAGQVTTLAAAGNAIWAITSAGEIYTWGGGRPLTRLAGRGPWSAIGTGTTAESVCGILAADATVYCWDFTNATNWGAVRPRPVLPPAGP